MGERRHKYLFTYRSGKSTTVAIHELTGFIQGAAEAEQVVPVSIINTQAPFDIMSYAAIEKPKKRKFSKLDYELHTSYAGFQAHDLGANRDVLDY